MAASAVQSSSSNGNSMASTSQGQAIMKKRKRSEGSNSTSANKMTKAIIAQDLASAAQIDEELDQQLKPRREDCESMVRIIQNIDHIGVANEKLPEQAGVSTLLDAFQSDKIYPLSSLASFLDFSVSAAKARVPQISAGPSDSNLNIMHAAPTSKFPHWDPPLVMEGIRRFAGNIHSMLNELKDEAIERLGQQRVKQPSKPKYALHRSIGTSYDVFSSVTDTIPRDDKAWRELTDTDLLAVYPTELADPSSAPRLGDLNGIHPMSTKRAIELQPEIEPVSFLYHDPYQSFAPTYDSSTATLSYAQSVSLRESRQAAEEWSNKPLPPLPPADLPSSIRPRIEDTLAVIDPALFSLSSEVEKIDPSELRVYLRMMEDSQVIDQRLQENTELLRALQEAQWHRLRKSEPTASEVELKSARRLLESLTSLANARPRTPDIPESASPYNSSPFIPASIVQSKPRAYYGVLDKANSKGIPDYVMAKDEHGAGNGGSAPNLTRKNSTNQSGKKAKKASKGASKANGKSISPAVQMSELPNIAQAQVKQETPAV